MFLQFGQTCRMALLGACVCVTTGFATTDPAILTALDDAIADWAKLEPEFAAPKAGRAYTKDQQAVVFRAINDLTAQLDTIEPMYAQTSKMDL